MSFSSRNHRKIYASNLRKRSRFSKLKVACIAFSAFFCYNYVSITSHLSLQNDLSFGDSRRQRSNVMNDFSATHYDKGNPRGSSKSTTKTNYGSDPELWNQSTTSIWQQIRSSKSNMQTSSQPPLLGIHDFRPGNDVTKLIVLGERHSGTTFFTKHLQDCFPGITVTDSFINYKHWFQPPPDALRTLFVDSNVSHKYGGDELPSYWRDIAGRTLLSKWNMIVHDYFQDTLVIVLFRDPYDWVEAMRRKPWHWPNHISFFPLTTKNSILDVKTQLKNNDGMGGTSVQKGYVGFDLLGWEDFVERPLHLEVDYNPSINASIDTPLFCQNGYPVGAVTPCRKTSRYVPKALRSIPPAFLRHLPFDTNNPIYEEDASRNAPFRNLMELRAAKVKNFLNIPNEWELSGIGFVPYEALLETNRLDTLLAKIVKALGKDVQSSCPSLPPFPKSPYNISEAFRRWTTNATNWDLEALIGYSPS